MQPVVPGACGDQFASVRGLRQRARGSLCQDREQRGIVNDGRHSEAGSRNRSDRGEVGVFFPDSRNRLGVGAIRQDSLDKVGQLDGDHGRS